VAILELVGAEIGFDSDRSADCVYSRSVDFVMCSRAADLAVIRKMAIMNDPNFAFQVGERVLLRTGVPKTGLQAGDSGVVRSIWFFESDAYEVEVPARGREYGTRVILRAEQIEPLAKASQRVA
jgi:hypothetical protein